MMARYGSLFELDPHDLVEFAQKWADLGDCIVSQVRCVLRGEDPLEQNPAALKRAQEELQGFNEQLDHEIEAALKAFDEKDKLDESYDIETALDDWEKGGATQ
jgi:hypothetical protein